MSDGIYPIETDEELERARVAAVLEKQIYDLMHTAPSEDELLNYCTDADVMMKIAKRKIKSSIVEEAERIYTSRTQAEIRAKIRETFVGILQLGNCAA